MVPNGTNKCAYWRGRLDHTVKFTIKQTKSFIAPFGTKRVNKDM